MTETELNVFLMIAVLRAPAQGSAVVEFRLEMIEGRRDQIKTSRLQEKAVRWHSAKCDECRRATSRSENQSSNLKSSNTRFRRFEVAYWSSSVQLQSISGASLAAARRFTGVV